MLVPPLQSLLVPAAFCKWRKWRDWVVHCSCEVTEECSDVPPHCLTMLRVSVSKVPVKFLHI